MNKSSICCGVGAVAVGLSLLTPGLAFGEVAAERGTGGFRMRLENGDFVHVWKTPGSYEFTVPGTGEVDIRYLVVVGGGAGGGGGGGGGGAGAVKEGAITLAAGTKISFTVGAGGKGHLLYGYRGENGEATTLTADATTIAAAGGGAGGAGLDNEVAANAGASGGGGGAASRKFVGGGEATDGGNAGGSGGGTESAADFYTGGGGGGAGAPGGCGGNYQSGNGGDGVASDITGEERHYGGGGGGGGYSPNNQPVVARGRGGRGGGGDGGSVGGEKGVKSSATLGSPCVDATPGEDGTGGGGGAGGYVYSDAGGSFLAGGASGGSGTVILRYASSAASQADDSDEEPAVETEDPGALSFARVFSDHAVLQRGKDLKVWGRAPAGTAVTVAFANPGEQRSADVTAGADGTWEVTLAALSASAEPGTLKVSDAEGHAKTLIDILVGDVWIADGQSNMDMQLWQTQGTKVKSLNSGYLEYAKDTTIRAMRVEKKYAGEPLLRGRELPENYSVGYGWCPIGKRFSAQTALAFHFALQLRAKGVTVPIGTITTSVGATQISKHMPGRDYYRDMVQPIERYGIQGAIWFQGEADASKPDGYAADFKTMVEGWRTAFGQGDFPFYWGQLAWSASSSAGRTYDPENATDVDAYANLREQQRLAIDLVPHGGMAVSFDVSMAHNVHFDVKAPVGERLAALALHDVYGQETAVREGPNVDHVELAEGGIRVIYRSSTVGSGLAVMQKGVDNDPPVPSEAALEGFALSEDGTSWTFADAAIDGDAVIVASAKVASPRYVRYAMMQVPLGHANLYNRDGFPATPFAAQEADGWVARPNTVRFVNWDGSAIRTQSLDDGEHPTPPPQHPTRAGWTFLGWKLGSDDAAVLSDAEVAATVVSGNADITYVAVFKEDEGGQEEPQVDPEKEVVEPPVLPDMVYTGELQKPDINLDANTFFVEQNDGGVEVGRYPVVLRLIEPARKTWPTTSSETLTVYFSITEAPPTDLTTSPMPDHGDWGYVCSYRRGGKGYAAYVYTNVAASMTFTVPNDVTALDYLVVAGGGSGASRDSAELGGGGGGGGGVLQGNGVPVSAGQSFSVKVGAGADGVTGRSSGRQGGNSSLACAEASVRAEAIGGGGGGQYQSDGGAGGCGGGGGAKNGGDSKASDGGKGTSGQGSAGGAGWDFASGGGGGAGGPGGDASSLHDGGAGGAGFESAISGMTRRYGAGGAGSGSTKNGVVGKDGAAATDGAGVGEDGRDGLGAGGGGQVVASKTAVSGAGGDGTVIIRCAVAGGDDPEPEQPTVNGQKVDPERVFEIANSRKPISYPRSPTVSGTDGHQTIAFGGKTVDVPEYYTATPVGNTVTLALNDNAKPKIADGTDGTKAFVVTDTTVSLHLEHTYENLFYARATCAKLDGTWTTGKFEKGKADFTVNRDKSASACFCKIVVSDHE